MEVAILNNSVKNIWLSAQADRGRRDRLAHLELGESRPEAAREGGRGQINWVVSTH